MPLCQPEKPINLDDWLEHIVAIDPKLSMQKRLATWTIEHVWVTEAQFNFLSRIVDTKASAI
jgi:hypothetical protein